jgi:hypothetical protein
LSRPEEGGGVAAPLLPSLRAEAMPAGGRSRTAPRRFLPGRASLPPWSWVAAGGVLLVIAAGVGIALGPELRPAPARVAPQADPEPVQGEVAKARNARGGYSLRYPDGWRVRERGTATIVRAPGDRAVVTFGIGPRGDIQEAERDLVAGIRRSYRQVRLTALQVAPIADRPAVSVAGTGRNDRGVRIRFLAATVEGSGRNFAITMFTGSDAGRLMPVLQGILDSFRITG